MPQKNLCKDDIMEYILPEFETLRAFFATLHLKNTNLAFSLLENVFENELEQRYKDEEESI